LPSVVDPWRSGAAASNLTLLPTLAAAVVVVVVASVLLSSLLPPLPSIVKHAARLAVAKSPAYLHPISDLVIVA
jgi:hypothetical protein